jgi:Transcriptional regulator containing an amidase domain and an AraC-type DNA-binding HTH domain
MMPGLDGFELCRRLKAEEDLRMIPVLLLTARAGEEATREGLSSGADDYVAKPFDVGELRRRIENHLAARRHLQARYRDEVEIGATVVDEEDRSFVEELIGVIDEHLSNPDLTVGQLADEMALSRRQFSRRVKRATGEPPGTFLRSYRIEQAKTMLERDPGTIAEVAYAVGFTSPSSFSQAFRKHVGTSPSTYADEQHSTAGQDSDPDHTD